MASVPLAHELVDVVRITGCVMGTISVLIAALSFISVFPCWEQQPDKEEINERRRRHPSYRRLRGELTMPIARASISLEESKTEGEGGKESRFSHCHRFFYRQPLPLFGSMQRGLWWRRKAGLLNLIDIVSGIMLANIATLDYCVPRAEILHFSVLARLLWQLHMTLYLYWAWYDVYRWELFTAITAVVAWLIPWIFVLSLALDEQTEYYGPTTLWCSIKSPEVLMDYVHYPSIIILTINFLLLFILSKKTRSLTHDVATYCLSWCSLLTLFLWLPGFFNRLQSDWTPGHPIQWLHIAQAGLRPLICVVDVLIYSTFLHPLGDSISRCCSERCHRRRIDSGDGPQLRVQECLQKLETLFDIMAIPACELEKHRYCLALAKDSRIDEATLRKALEEFCCDFKKKKTESTFGKREAVELIKEYGLDGPRKKLLTSFREEFETWIKTKWELAEGETRSEHKQKLKERDYAANVLNIMGASVAAEFSQCMRDAILGDPPQEGVVVIPSVKGDVQRITEKIVDYAEEKKDDYGFKYMKDIVRMTFKFDKITLLCEAMGKLMTGQTQEGNNSNSYIVLDWKVKLSELRNVTIWVGYRGENGERVVGEVQLAVAACESSRDDEIVDHLKYELQRIIEDPNWRRSKNKPLYLAFRRVMFKIYEHPFEGPTGHIRFLTDNENFKLVGPRRDTQTRIITRATWEGKDVAVVELREDVCSHCFCRGAELLSGLRHTNVVEIHGMCVRPPRVVMTWVEHDLETYQTQPSTFADRLLICCGIAKGLAFLHRHGVLHGNLRTDNVLLHDYKTPVLAGFDNAKLLTKLLKPDDTMFSTDIESCGKLLYSVLTRKQFVENRPGSTESELPAPSLSRSASRSHVKPQDWGEYGEAAEVVEPCWWSKGRPNARKLQDGLTALLVKIQGRSPTGRSEIKIDPSSTEH